jgi:hypothetical protein
MSSEISSKYQSAQGQAADEVALVQSMMQTLESARDSSPDYWAWLEDSDVTSIRRAELVELIASAPTVPIKFWLLGQYQTRLQIALITGRQFL